MPHESTVNHESTRMDQSGMKRMSSTERKDQASGSNHPNSVGVNRSASVATNTTAHSTPVDGNTPGADGKVFKVAAVPSTTASVSTTTMTGTVDSVPKSSAPGSDVSPHPQKEDKQSSKNPGTATTSSSSKNGEKHGHLEKSQSLLPHICPEKPTEVTHHHDTDEEDSENSDETK